MQARGEVGVTRFANGRDHILQGQRHEGYPVRPTVEHGAVKLHGIPGFPVGGRCDRDEQAMGTLPPLLPDQSGQKMLGGELGEVTGQKARRLGIEMKGAGTGEFPIPGRPAPSRLSHILGILDLDSDEGGPTVRAGTAHEEVEGGVVTEIARITTPRRVLEGQLLHLREEAGEEALEEAMAAFLIHLAQCEQVEGERLARQEIFPQALLIDEGAIFSIGYGTASQPGDVRCKEITTTTRIGGIQATAKDAEAPISPSMSAGSKSKPCTP